MDSRMHVEVEEQNSDWVGSAKKNGRAVSAKSWQTKRTRRLVLSIGSDSF